VPDDGGAVPGDAGEPGVAGAEGDAVHAVLVTREFGRQAALARPPEAYETVLAAGRQEVAVGTEGDGAHPAAVPVEGGDAGPGGAEPDADGVVVVGGGQQVTRVVEGLGPDVPGLGVQFAQELAVLAPQVDAAVVAGDAEDGPGGAERGGDEPVAAPGEFPGARAGAGVPEAYRPVAAAGGEAGAVGAERDAGHAPAVAAQDAFALAGGGVPDLGAAVVAHGQQLGFVRVEGARPGGSPGRGRVRRCRAGR
jgi:hypothetical protein